MLLFEYDVFDYSCVFLKLYVQKKVVIYLVPTFFPPGGEVLRICALIVVDLRDC